MRVSIIIPTLNEATVIEKTLVRALLLAPYEIIISDGGSVDETLSIAQRYNCRIETSSAGRALQMNKAAQMAHGDILVFLHADSFIDPVGYQKMIDNLKNKDIVGGAFSLGIESDQLPFKIIARLATWRAKYLHMAYGDQTIFARSDVFKEIGGFSPIPICEDLDFFNKLRNRGNTLIIDEMTMTSPRRWQKEGLAYTTLRNIAIASLFTLGFSPKVLSRWYTIIR